MITLCKSKGLAQDVTRRFSSAGVTPPAWNSGKAMTRARDGHLHGEAVFFRSLIIAVTAFLTLVDLFATQAILPSLTSRYGVTPGAMARLQCEHLWHARVPELRSVISPALLSAGVEFFSASYSLVFPQRSLLMRQVLPCLLPCAWRRGFAWPQPLRLPSLISASIIAQRIRQVPLLPTSPAVLQAI